MSVDYFKMAVGICYGNLDRFSQGLPDPQDALSVRSCDGCGEDIYPGTAYQDDDGKVYCEDFCATGDTLQIEINAEGEIWS